MMDHRPYLSAPNSDRWWDSNLNRGVSGIISRSGISHTEYANQKIGVVNCGVSGLEEMLPSTPYFGVSGLQEMLRSTPYCGVSGLCEQPHIR